ncbi:MAG: TlpA family protein disulfide reductase [Flavobacteriaceae bacterium]|nr:TlpA family protein disulfide reductase [Flavobacteriaceae bacterium]
MKNFALLLLVILICGCKKETEKITYYKLPNGKIFTTEEYNDVKKDISKRGKITETIISTTEKKDSIIKFVKTTFTPNIDPHAKAKTYIGKKLPFKSLTDLNGKNFNLKSLNGKPSLINFWFTTCIPCIDEMPILNSIKDHYGDSVNFISITFETDEKVKKFLKKYEFNFTHFPNSKKEIDVFGNKSYPLNVFLDKNGIVKFLQGNPMDKNGEDFKKMINKLL